MLSFQRHSISKRASSLNHEMQNIQLTVDSGSNVFSEHQDIDLTVKSEAAIFNQAGPVLFSASRDKTIKMWDPIVGRCIRKFSGHLNWVKEITVHPGGLTIASCSDDKSIKVWDVLTGKKRSD